MTRPSDLVVTGRRGDSLKLDQRQRKSSRVRICPNMRCLPQSGRPPPAIDGQPRLSR